MPSPPRLGARLFLSSHCRFLGLLKHRVIVEAHGEEALIGRDVEAAIIVEHSALSDSGAALDGEKVHVRPVWDSRVDVPLPPRIGVLRLDPNDQFNRRLCGVLRDERVDVDGALRLTLCKVGAQPLREVAAQRDGALEIKVPPLQAHRDLAMAPSAPRRCGRCVRSVRLTRDEEAAAW